MLFSKMSPRFCNELTKIGHKFTKQSWSKMIEIKNDLNETCSSNLVFLRENHFQRDSVTISSQKLTLNFENALFLSAHLKIFVTVGGKNNYLGLISEQN